MGANPEGYAGNGLRGGRGRRPLPTIFEWGDGLRGQSPSLLSFVPSVPLHSFRFISLKCSDWSVFQSINILCPPPSFLYVPAEVGGTRKKWGTSQKIFLLASLAKLVTPPHFQNAICFNVVEAASAADPVGSGGTENLIT